MSSACLADLFAFAGAALDVPSVKGPNDHVGARAVLTQAFRNVTGRDATQTEIQAVQAIAHYETGYGQLGQFAGKNAHNWGAVQVPGTRGLDPTAMPADAMPGHDTQPNTDGTSTTYTVGFRIYPDDVAGAAGTVRELTRRPKTYQALATGDADQIAAAMRLERYYEGKGATQAERVANYAKAIASRAKQVATALGEPQLVDRRGGSVPVNPWTPPTVNPLPATDPSDGGSIALPAALSLAALLGVTALARTARTGEEAPLGTAAPASSSLLPNQAVVGDWLPTFVTPDDAKRYILETDSAWQMTSADVASSKLGDADKAAWLVDLKSWNAFRDEATRDVGWLNTKATMEQTDRWSGKLILWRQSLAQAGAKLSGPLLDPGQGLPSKEGPGVFSAGWIQIGLAIAALFAAGYLVRSFKL